MLKKLLAVLLLLSVAFSLFGCGVYEESAEYIEKQVAVHYIDGSLDTTVGVRFYGDIPYISIADYVKLLYRGRDIGEGRDGVTVKRSGSSYTVTPCGGTNAVFDVKENTFKTDNFALFKNTHLTAPGIEGTVPYDALPFILVESVEVDGEAVPMTIDFDDYGIDIYGDKTAVYLPFTTLSDMFSCMNLLVSAYNGHDFYVYYSTENENSADLGAGYFNALRSGKVSESYAEYNYNELCLDYDMFLGRPGRSSLEKYCDLSGGLDAALENSEFGRALKQNLRSTDIDEYLAGLIILDVLVGDGGHSSCNAFNTSYYYENEIAKLPGRMTWEYYYELVDIAREIVNNDGAEAAKNPCVANRYHGNVYKARADLLGKPESAIHGEQTYTLIGDTAIIHIDGFMNEIMCFDAWNDYYAGKTDEIPFDAVTGGAVGAAYFGLKKANEDGVKRIIIDLSANTGGSTDEMMYMISLLTNSRKLYSKDRTTGQLITTTYKIDRNLDRVFDEKDDEFDLVGDKEIAVITSRNGFSCGGISPVYLHELGLYTLGENCGGGSCAIYYQHDAFGFKRIASCPVQICGKDGVDVDTLRLTSCDTFLDITADENGVPDYTAFFDVENLNALIDARYAGRK